MKKRVLNILLASFFTVFAVTASAGDGSEKHTQAEQPIEEIKARLNLTEEQKEQVTPIFKKSMEKRQSTLKSYGIDLENQKTKSGQKIGFREARKLKNEMDEVRSHTLTELKTVLTDEQLVEYEEIQEEIASKIRSRIRAAR